MKYKTDFQKIVYRVVRKIPEGKVSTYKQVAKLTGFPRACPPKFFSSLNMYFVYILQSQKDGNLYIGCTNNLKRRLELHNSGKVFSTKSRRPLFLIYCEVYHNEKDAFAREKFLKSGWGKNYIRKVLKNFFQEQEKFRRAWRAVGNILNKNRNSEIPCHRVIRSDGKIGGYKNGTKKKAFLLKKENVRIN